MENVFPEVPHTLPLPLTLCGFLAFGFLLGLFSSTGSSVGPAASRPPGGSVLLSSPGAASSPGAHASVAQADGPVRPSEQRCSSATPLPSLVTVVSGTCTGYSRAHRSEEGHQRE